jgi:integral membrane protein (TIGR01906 family)
VRTVSAWFVGLAFALMVAGLALLPLTGPGFTRAVATRFSLAEEAGLPPERMLDVAEQVRAFVVDAKGDTLPETVDGRSGFDAGATSHLIDVRTVLSRAKLVTGLITMLLVVWIALQVRAKRFDRIVAALRAGAVLTIVLIGLAAVAAVSDFESFFTAFHGLFFRSGTWTFPYDSLLIQTFPEPFWATCGAAWAGVIVLGAAVLAGLAQALAHSRRDPTPKTPE